MNKKTSLKNYILLFSLLSCLSTWAQGKEGKLLFVSDDLSPYLNSPHNQISKQNVFHSQKSKSSHELNFQFRLAKDLKEDDVLYIQLYSDVLGQKDEILVIPAITSQVMKKTWLPLNPAEPKLKFAIKIRRDYSSSQGKFSLKFKSNATFKIQFNKIKLSSFSDGRENHELPVTPVHYQGEDKDAQWRQGIQSQIAQHRQGQCAIQVYDSHGKLLKKSDLHIKLSQHHFLFGTGGSNQYWLNKNKDSHRAKIKEHFNSIAPGWALNWPIMQKVINRGKDPWQDSEELYQWAAKENLRFHALHALWPGWNHMPPEIKKSYLKLNASQPKQAKSYLRQTILARIKSLALHGKGRTFAWNVLNETITNNHIEKILGLPFLAECFKVMHQIDPDALLLINDYDIICGDSKKIEVYISKIKALQALGAPISAVGVQCHMKPESMLILKKRFERLAELNLPIFVTEYDLVSPDEKFQAKFTKDFMELAFSQANCRGFIIWGFWDTDHWLKDAPLYYRNWQLKPSGQAYQDLRQKWHTELTLSSNTNGQATFKGFYGRYQVEYKNQKQEFYFYPKQNKLLKIQLKKK